MTALTELIARVEGAEGADRELDCDVGVAVGIFWVEPREYRSDAYCMRGSDGGTIMPGQGGDMLVPRYTSSLDAVTALIAEKLPEEQVEVFFPFKPTAFIRHWDGDWVEEATAATPALALLAATLRALKAIASTGESA